MSVYAIFGDKVRKTRRNRNMTQEQLAERIDRDVRTIGAIETGSANPTLKTIHKIALALKVPLADLF